MVCPDGCRIPERHSKGSHKDWLPQTFNTFSDAAGLFYNVIKQNIAYGKEKEPRITIKKA